jgi:hypothetical protein
MSGLTNLWGRPLARVHDHLYARALVLSSGSTTAAVITADLGLIDATSGLRERIEKETGIPASNVLVCPTNNYSSPRVDRSEPRTAAYTAQVYTRIIEAVREAKAKLQTARLGVGTGISDVNVNRDEYTPNGYIYGNALNGPSDKTVWVVKFETLEGEPIAFFLNYGVHSLVMGPDNPEISGDLAGATSRFVEQRFHDRVVTLFSMGPAADQNPRYQNWDPNDQKVREPGYSLTETLGRMLGEEALRVAGSVTRMDSAAAVWIANETLQCPGQSLDREAEKKGEFKYIDTSPVDIRLDLLMVGNVAFAGISAEVVTRIYEHLRRDSPFTNIMLLSMANGSVGDLTDDESYGRTSYSARATPAKEGCAESGIVDGFVEMMNQY